MTEQLKGSQEKQSRKQSPNMHLPALHNDGTYIEAGDLLDKLDAAIDDYLNSPLLVGPSVVVDQQQVHQVIKPLSDKAFVEGFVQKSGE